MARYASRMGLCLSSLLALSLAATTEHELSTLVARAEANLAEIGERSHELVAREDESPKSFFQFITRPDLQAPRWDITTLDADAISPGYWFLSPYSSLDQAKHDQRWVGPYIYSPDGELVWSGAETYEHWNVMDFKPANIHGERKLSLLYMHEAGSGIILNDDYSRWSTQAINPDEAHAGDMHAFHVLPEGDTALTITIDHKPATRLQSQDVGFDGECNFGFRGFAEINLDTQKSIFRWSARNHIGLDESMKWDGTYKEMCKNGWDALHLNSVDKFPDGDYLLSSRHTNALYKIDHTTGDIVWRLGGTKNDFKKMFVFSRQHHARVQSQNSSHTVITLFDNAIGTENNETASNDISRGMQILLHTDQHPMTARLLTAYPHPNAELTNSRGSMEMMPNGNAFICWTYGSLLTEHAPDGKQVLKARTKGGFNTYRIFKGPWTGRPSAPPDVRSVAIEKEDGVRTSVWVSWNGATEVDTWNLHRSTKDGQATEFLVSAPKRGFETPIVQKIYASYVIVEGLDANGNSLGASHVITTERAAGMNRTLVEDDALWLQAHSTQTPTDVTKTGDDNFNPAPEKAHPTIPDENFTPRPTAPYPDGIKPEGGKSTESHTTYPSAPTTPADHTAAGGPSNLDSSTWRATAKSASTSHTATFFYGVLAVVFFLIVRAFIGRRRSGNSAWWRKNGSNNQKYDVVWDNHSMEMLAGDDEGKEHDHSRR